jgi:hypothetical protein
MGWSSSWALVATGCQKWVKAASVFVTTGRPIAMGHAGRGLVQRTREQSGYRQGFTKLVGAESVSA